MQTGQSGIEPPQEDVSSERKWDSRAPGDKDWRCCWCAVNRNMWVPQGEVESYFLPSACCTLEILEILLLLWTTSIETISWHISFEVICERLIHAERFPVLRCCCGHTIHNRSVSPVFCTYDVSAKCAGCRQMVKSTVSFGCNKSFLIVCRLDQCPILLQLSALSVLLQTVQPAFISAGGRYLRKSPLYLIIRAILPEMVELCQNNCTNRNSIFKSSRHLTHACPHTHTNEHRCHSLALLQLSNHGLLFKLSLIFHDADINRSRAAVSLSGPWLTPTVIITSPFGSGGDLHWGYLMTQSSAVSYTVCMAAFSTAADTRPPETQTSHTVSQVDVYQIHVHLRHSVRRLCGSDLKPWAHAEILRCRTGSFIVSYSGQRT